MSTAQITVLPAASDSASGTNLTLEHLTRTRAQDHAQHVSPTRDATEIVQVYGILLGTQTGPTVEIHNSFEMRVSPSAAAPSSSAAGATSAVEVDHGLLRTRLDLYKQVFPTLLPVGWYSVSSSPSSSQSPTPTQLDLSIHTQLLEYTDAPLLLQLDLSSNRFARAQATGELPLRCYETVVEMASSVPAGEEKISTNASGTKTYLLPIPHRIETGDAERIAVEHVSRFADDSASTSTSALVTAGDVDGKKGGEKQMNSAVAARGTSNPLLSNLATSYQAIRMLHDRVEALCEYIARVTSALPPSSNKEDQTLAQIRAAATSGKEETSEIQPSPTFDPETLRQVSALCSLLSAATRTAASTSDPSVDVTPVEGQPGIRMELEQELRAEHQDVLLTNQLSTLTSSLHSLNELIDKFDYVSQPDRSSSALGAREIGGGRGIRATRRGMRQHGAGGKFGGFT